MQPVLTPVEMAEADRRAVAAGTPVEILMDRAGRAVAWEVRRILGRTYGVRVVVVCGKGNNGGDGLVAARVLRGWGVRVDAFELANGMEGFDRAVGRADVLVDAMFGTGFRGTLDGDAEVVARASSRLATVAVDIPSGVDGVTGAVAGEAVQAVSTVTFAARKPGVCFEPGRSHAGEVRVADIGVDAGATAAGSRQVDRATHGHGCGLWIADDLDVSAWLPSRSPATHKWQTGVLVIGGSGGMTGAPELVSRAAMRSGAGIVWCALPGAEAAARASGTEVITRAMPADTDGALIGVDDEVRGALGRFRAVVLGPGLGTAGPTRAVARDLLAEVPVPLVLDADGLNALAGEPEVLRSRPAPTVLTPHEGEFEHMMGEPVGDDRVAAARRLAAASDCTVVLKGPGTVIAEPGGRAGVNPVDGPWLGTAGSGDVLSGIIGGFLARGLGPFEAATAAALVHGRAADLAGHTGLVAGDLVAALPATLAALEA